MVCVIYFMNTIVLYSDDSMCHFLSAQLPFKAFVLQLRCAMQRFLIPDIKFMIFCLQLRMSKCIYWKMEHV